MACSTSTHTTRGLPYRFAHHRPPRQMVMCVEHRQSQRRIGTRLLVHRRTTIVCEHTRYRLIDILVSLTEIAFAAPTTALDVDRLNFPSVAFGIILATYAINAALTSSLISHPRWSSGAGSIPGSPAVGSELGFRESGSGDRWMDTAQEHYTKAELKTYHCECVRKLTLTRG